MKLFFGTWNDKQSQLTPDWVAAAILRDSTEEKFRLLVTNNFGIWFDKQLAKISLPYSCKPLVRPYLLCKESQSLRLYVLHLLFATMILVLIEWKGKNRLFVCLSCSLAASSAHRSSRFKTLLVLTHFLGSSISRRRIALDWNCLR